MPKNPQRNHSEYRDSREEINFEELTGVSAQSKKSFDVAKYALEAAALVRDIRNKADNGLGIDQSELARRMNVTQARISQLERGDGPRGPTYAMLKRVAIACNVELQIIAIQKK